MKDKRGADEDGTLSPAEKKQKNILYLEMRF